MTSVSRIHYVYHGFLRIVVKAVPGGEPGVTFQTVFRLYELYIYIYTYSIFYI